MLQISICSVALLDYNYLEIFLPVRDQPGAADPAARDGRDLYDARHDPEPADRAGHTDKEGRCV